jgi:hypothetical protein
MVEEKVQILLSELNSQLKPICNLSDADCLKYQKPSLLLSKLYDELEKNENNIDTDADNIGIELKTRAIAALDVIYKVKFMELGVSYSMTTQQIYNILLAINK